MSGRLRSQLVRGGMGIGLLKILSLSLSLLLSVLLARGLGPEGYGQYAFVVALLSVISIPVGPALMQLMIRESADLVARGRENLIYDLFRWANRNAAGLSLSMAVLFGGYALWKVQWHEGYIADRWFLLLLGIVSLPAFGFNGVRFGLMVGLRRVVLGQLPELFIRPLILLLLCSALLAFGNLTPVSAIAAFVVGAYVVCLVGGLLLRKISLIQNDESSVDPSQVQQWRRAWVPFTLLAAASSLNAQIGILMLGWLSSEVQVAAMQVAERGAMLVALSLTVVNLTIGPHITQVFRQGDRRRLQALSGKSARIALLVALPIAIPLIVSGNFIVSFVFGDEYAAISSVPLAILAFGQLVNVAFGSVGLLLIMSGYERDTLYGQLVALVLNPVLGFFLIPSLGAIGAATSTAVGLVTWNAILAILVVRRLKIIPTVISPPSWR